MVDKGLLAKTIESEDSGPSKEIYERRFSAVGLADLNRPYEDYDDCSKVIARHSL